MKLNNKYYILRHGEAISNIKQITSCWPETFYNPLTSKGREQIKKAAKVLREKNIDLIFTSDLLRTRQTAEVVGKLLNLEPKIDIRLREASFGDLNGKPTEELLYVSYAKEHLKDDPQQSEPYESVVKRLMEFFREINQTYRNRNILIISHQAPLWVLENNVKGLSLKQALENDKKRRRISKGEIRELQ